MSSYKRWTDKEKEILRENYGRISKGSLKNLLPSRTWSAITSYAKFLGITQPCRCWTEKEDALVKEYYATMVKDDLKKLLPSRTWQGIQSRAKHFGLTRAVASWVGQKTTLHLTEFEKGYLAGIIDGDGCITLSSDKRRGMGTCYSPRVVIYNTDVHIINYLRKILDGFGKFQMHHRHSKRRVMYRLSLSRMHDAYVVLSNIVSHLVGKKRQAELMLEYINIRRSWRREIIRDEKGRILQTRGSKTTEREKEIYEEIHSLNVGGRARKVKI